jgi:hypothetical protein
MPGAASIRIAKNQDGRLDVFLIDATGAAWHKSQLAAPASSVFTWSEWKPLGGAGLRECEPASDASGRLVMFARNGGGAISVRSQVAPNGDWGDWRPLGGRLLTQFTAGNLQDGSLQLFAVGGDQLVYSIGQAGPNGAWGAWSLFGGNLPVSSVTAGKNADGRLELYALDPQGAVFHKWQSGGAWVDWNPMQGHGITQLAAAQNQDGRVEVFALGGDQVPYHAWQLAPNGSWSGWAGGIAATSVVQIAVERDAAGALQLFLLNVNGSVARLGQTAPNGGWEQAASDLQGSHITQIAAARNPQGRLELFAVTDDGTVWHRGQNESPNWSGWKPLDASQGPEVFNHPQLTHDQDLLQRGGDPVPPHHDAPPPAPVYKSDPARRQLIQGILPSILGGRRFRQDMLLPYLLIRSFPRDHGKRPDRIPDAASSPDLIAVEGKDVLSLDGATPADRGIMGHPYTVFVRVWNLGLLAAIGVTLSAYYGQYEVAKPPFLVSQTFFDLPDCYNPGCRTVVRLPLPWIPQGDSEGWDWLGITVSCFADVAPSIPSRLWLPNALDKQVVPDRHIALRRYRRTQG